MNKVVINKLESYAWCFANSSEGGICAQFIKCIKGKSTNIVGEIKISIEIIDNIREQLLTQSYNNKQISAQVNNKQKNNYYSSIIENFREEGAYRNN